MRNRLLPVAYVNDNVCNRDKEKENLVEFCLHPILHDPSHPTIALSDTIGPLLLDEQDR